MARPGNATLAAAGAALLGIGFGLGMWTAGREPEREPIVRVVEKQAAVVAPRPEPPAARPSPPPAPPPPAPPVPAPPAWTPSAADLEAIRRLLPEISAAPVAPGTGVIRGRIQMEDGRPFPGVEVTLQGKTPPGSFPGRWRPGEEEASLEAEVASAIAQSRWARETRRKCVTDAAGEYRFEGVPEAGHGLYPRLAGWQFFARNSNLAYSAGPGAEVDFVANPVVEVTVEVVHPDGTAARQAMVHFRPPGGNNSVSWNWSPEHPTLQMKPGTYRASAATGAWNREESKTEEQDLALPEGSPPTTIRFVLRGSAGIRGRVEFDGYSLEGGLTVRCARMPAGGGADPALLEGRGVRSASAHSHDGFSFSFPDLSPDRYLLGVALSPQGKPIAREEVEVGSAFVTRNLRVGAIDTGDLLVVRVLAPDGSPVEGVQFTKGHRKGNSSSSSGGQELRRSDGVYLVAPQDPGTVVAEGEAKWWIEAASPLHGTKRVEYRPDEAREIVIRFDEPGRVEVTVTGYRGSPLEGSLQVAVQPVEAGGSSGRHYFDEGTRLDAEGRATVAGLQPGECEVVVLMGEYPHRTVARFPVTVRSGRIPVSIPVPTLHSVTVFGAEGPAHLRKKGDPYWNDSRNASADGRVGFDGLPEGDYTVRSGSKSQDFHLPGTAEVRLQ